MDEVAVSLSFVKWTRMNADKEDLVDLKTQDFWYYFFDENRLRQWHRHSLRESWSG